MIVEHGQMLMDLLESKLAPMWIERTPMRPEQYTLRSQHGAILIGYAGRKFDDPSRPTVFGVQEITWALTILKKNLQRYGAQDGIEELLDELGRVLHGVRYDGFIYYPSGDGYSDYDESTGVWSYVMDVVGYRSTELEGLS